MNEKANHDITVEGGVDFAEILLKHYDPVKRRWDMALGSKFWSAVDMAHELGRFGDGQTIAVIDDGFDLSIPALAEQAVMWKAGLNTPSAHGTVVALLILAVAPSARLLLYPVDAGGKMDKAAIKRALHEVRSTSAEIVNLSLGASHPLSSMIDFKNFIGQLTPWPEMSDDDIPYLISQKIGELGNWRCMIKSTPESIFESPISELEKAGITIVAAAGNMKNRIFDPAFRMNVISAAYHRVERSSESGMETAIAVDPSYSQSELYDFAIVQPDGVLGSSFAAPLISGFIALMESRRDLPRYRKAAYLSGLAEKLMVTYNSKEGISFDRRSAVIDNLFLKAMQALPHNHFKQNSINECPECVFWASSAIINYGLFKLNWNDLDGAEYLLRCAEQLVPENPHAAANLAMVYAKRAQQAQADRNIDRIKEFLNRAAKLQEKASRLRPEFKPYQLRAKEFSAGMQYPLEWKLRP